MKTLFFQDIEMYELSAKKKEQEVSQVRLEFIKLKNRLKKQEAQLKQKVRVHVLNFLVWSPNYKNFN